jgi:DNA-binding transcriptional regulator YdaS (Cro superfamily)
VDKFHLQKIYLAVKLRFMTLSEYLQKHSGAAKALAKKLGVSQAAVSYWRHGVRKIPVAHCLAIRDFTGGEVTLPEMRDDHALYWRCRKRSKHDGVNVSTIQT